VIRLIDNADIVSPITVKIEYIEKAFALYSTGKKSAIKL
jgi:hypothetical protein